MYKSLFAKFAACFVLIMFGLFMFAASQSSAQTPTILDGPSTKNTNTPAVTGPRTTVNASTNNATQQTTSSSSGIMKFNRPLTGTFADLLSKIISLLLGMVATVALLFIIIGGFRMVFSQGNQDAVKKAKATITWAVLGLILAIVSFVVVRLVEQVLY